MTFRWQTIFGFPRPSYHELYVKDEYRTAIKFIVPSENALSESSEGLETTPTNPGNYFLRILYVATQRGNSWSGMVASDRINICIK